MRFPFLIFIGLCFCFASMSSFVPQSRAETPMPRTHPTKTIQQQLNNSAAREKNLKKKMKKIKSELGSKRKEMIAVAKQVKKNERYLIDLESRINDKRQEQLAIEVRLNEDRGAISDLVLALERMRRVPPEALLARPGRPLETAQSAMLLQSTLPRVYKRAENLKGNLESLKAVLESLKIDRKEVLRMAKKLEGSHKKLTALLTDREKLYSKTAKDVKKEQAELKQISLQAKNLRDLVARIEKKQREEDARYKAQASSFFAKSVRTPIPKAGEAQLPISGIIKVGYGKADDIGAILQGLKISGRAKALVVAPMGGVVDYAGHFKGYGEIIILKHQKGYHSLIAGLDKIDTVVGRAVSAGEPIGKMGKNSLDGSSPTLYYELRYKGRPVNPSKKISGLR